MKTVCVFCGSSQGSDARYLEEASNLGRTLAERGLTLVYGGGNIGTMGALARSCMDSGGRVIGIIPRRLHELVDHLDLSELLIVPDMHRRKALMQERSDAFIALPGGIGTLEELFEVWVWRSIGYHRKPVGILNTAGFYDRLLEFLNETVEKGFLRRDFLVDLAVSRNARELLDELERKLAGDEVPEPKLAERRRESAD